MAQPNQRPSKAERVVNAREHARELQQKQEAASKRKSRWIKFAVVLAALVVVALVVGILLSNSRNEVATSGPAPQGGNADGGIVLVSDTALADTSGVTVDWSSLGEPPASPGEPTPRGVAASASGDPAQVVVYVDANCVHCADFENLYADQLQTWLAAGDITLEYRNVAYLDRSSPTNFSSRGANAMACVADQAPASYMPFVKAVFAHHAQGEMSNDELSEMAKANGADVESCIEDGTFRPFVKFTDATSRIDAIPGTPSVWVQGQVWDGQADPDFAAWAQKLIDEAK